MYVLVCLCVHAWAQRQAKKEARLILWQAQQGRYLSDQWWAEVRQSFKTILVFALSMSLVGLAKMAGIYAASATGGWDPKEVLFLPVMLLTYDTYNYWSHRALHTPWLFAVHREHHLSVETTAWSTLRVNWVEAVIISIYYHLVAWLIPFHLMTLFLFYVVFTILSVIAHAGVELYGVRIQKSFWAVFWNSVAFHDQHHRSLQTNFSACFGFWDALCGTSSSKKKVDLVEGTP